MTHLGQALQWFANPNRGTTRPPTRHTDILRAIGLIEYDSYHGHWSLNEAGWRRLRTTQEGGRERG